MQSVVLAVGALCLFACGPRASPPASATTTPQATADHDQAPAITPADAAPVAVLSEAAARAILARRFRAAGFRVRYDVPIARPGAFDVTVDGYDPVRQVGFEYVDTAERDTDLHAAERAALERDPAHRILVVDATDAAGLEARITRFLAQP